MFIDIQAIIKVGGLSMLESKYQATLKEKLKKIFPGCVVLKNDGSNVPQGFPDLTVIYYDRWAMLECKASEKSSHRPQQDYYVQKFRQMGYASFIYPENEEEVLNELKSVFQHDYENS